MVRLGMGCDSSTRLAVLLRFGFFVFVLGAGVGDEQNRTDAAANAVAIECPMGRPRVQPGEDDHIAGDALQAEHAGAVGSQVVQIGNDRHFQSWLEQQAADERFFECRLAGLLLCPWEMTTVSLGMRGNGEWGIRK